ncbi:MAG: cytochrome b/b6 domain-containing protein [Pseudomonadales bacterium]
MGRGSEAGSARRGTLIWDAALRLWHWSFASAVAGALVTGLLRDVTLMTWHQRFGWVVLGLLIWRIGWGIWGSAPARFDSFKATLSARVTGGRFDRGPQEDGVARARVAQSSVRTVPGALLGLALPFFVLLQASAGLCTSDFIFNEGPLVRHASDTVVDVSSALHHRLYWIVIFCISLHLSAHLVYAVRGDSVVLGMITGRKQISVVPAEPRYGRAVLSAIAAAALLAAVMWVL